MYCVYVLKSIKDGELYVGRTRDLEARFIEHNKGKVTSTKRRCPFRIIYVELGNNIKDAAHREKYPKTAWGKRYLRNRLKNDNK